MTPEHMLGIVFALLTVRMVRALRAVHWSVVPIRRTR